MLPAVDVADGAAVRLVQGAAGTETSYGDPLEAYRRFAAIHSEADVEALRTELRDRFGAPPSSK